MISIIDDGLEILDDEECRRLLRSAVIGRVAISINAIPAVFPVNFVYDGAEIVFLTNEGTKLRAALDNTVVAFEVDELDRRSQTGWSVLAVGTASGTADPDALALARELGVRPWARSARDRVVRVRPELLTGRRIRGDGL